jgi:excisionase family DNA binding protein
MQRTPTRAAATEQPTPHTPPNDHRHLTPQDLADRAGVPLATVYRWNSEGTGPRYMTLGRHARYRLADVLAWENRRYAAHSGRNDAA